MQETDLDYHTRRAREELDLAYSSFVRAAIDAHLKMASLHLARIRDINLQRAALVSKPPEAIVTPETAAALV